MNEADIRGAAINNRDADSRVAATSGGDSMKARSLESAVDELFRMMLVPVMVFAIVVLRGWYQGRKRWPARLIEGVIFGMVATILHPVARYVVESRLGFPADVANNAAIAFVCALGYVGADTLSDAAKSYFGRE